MKIVIYGINYAPELTGIGKYSSEMAEWLVARGHEVQVVTAPPYYPQWEVIAPYNNLFYKHELINGVDVWRCPIWVPSSPSGIKRLFHLASFAISSFPLLLRKIFWRPDLVLVIEPPLFCAPAAALFSRLARCRSWLHIQDFEVDAAFELGLLRSTWLQRLVLTIESWLMHYFDKISTISGRMLECLRTKGMSDFRLVLFPNWVDTEVIYPVNDISPLREVFEIGSDEVVLLYSGNMGKKQGLEMVIEAARILQEDKSIRFVMCGQGATHDHLRSLADGLQNILWIPLQPFEQLNALLNLADIHLLPQHSEAADLVMPSKLTGILASARPVVATAAEGTEVWTVVEGRGINTIPGDLNAFVSAICKLARDPYLRQQLGAAARRYAEEYLGRDKVLERFETDLFNLIG